MVMLVAREMRGVLGYDWGGGKQNPKVKRMKDGGGSRGADVPAHGHSWASTSTNI
jgi:hypothetical protein